MLKNFRAFAVANLFYQRCKRAKVPKYLSDQFLRASSSIALNLAEGSGKRTPDDQRRFYTIALGSFRECQAIIELENIKDKEIEALATELGAMLYTLSRKPSQKSFSRTEN